MAHEVGHAHGRPHAPCGGAAGPDPGFPYTDGSIGTWAFAPTSQKLIDPGTTKDFMSYCHPQWISDYNYNKLLERLTHVNEAAATATPTAWLICCETLAKLVARLMRAWLTSA